MSEQWRPIQGYEGLYEVSDQGRVRSLDRFEVFKSGPRQGFRRIRRGRVLRTGMDLSGYPQAILSKNARTTCRKVHHLVLEAFVGPRSDGQLTRHLNSDRADARLTNLVWGTHEENCADALALGRHRNQRKTHCKRGHEFTPDNTRVMYTTTGSGRQRVCKRCNADGNRMRRLVARKAAA